MSLLKFSCAFSNLEIFLHTSTFCPELGQQLMLTLRKSTGPIKPDDDQQDLVQLVWKYFEEEIREAVIEVQQAVRNEPAGSADQITQRKQKRK